MARLPRLYAAGATQLVRADFVAHSTISPFNLTNPLLTSLGRWLGDAAQTHHVAIHGWSFTPHAIILLATPKDHQGISKVIQALGRHLAAAIQTGPVFKGRFHSALLEPGAWVLPALIWLERQSVREGVIHDPELWPWASVPAHTGATGLHPTWLTQHLDYWACGNTPYDRQAVYRKHLQEGNPLRVDSTIEQGLTGQWAIGSEKFLNEIAPLSSRRLRPAKRGRPKTSTTIANG